MDTEIEREDVEALPEEEAEETVPESDPEADPEEKPTEDDPKPEKPKETLEQKKARLERQLEQLNKKLKPAEDKPEPSQAKKGLDDFQLGYLELKGITEQEDLDLITSIMEKTGQPFREVLKDEYVTGKLEANKKARAAADAVPSQTKRPGSSAVDDVDFWYGKYSQKWELPANMPKGMAEKVIARRYENENPNAAPF